MILLFLGLLCKDKKIYWCYQMVHGEKKLAFRKALRQIRETGTKLRGSSDDDGTEEIVKNIGKADTLILEQKNIVTLDERIVTEIWTFSHMDEQHILHLFNTAEDNRKGPAGKRIEISENGTRYIIGKPTQEDRNKLIGLRLLPNFRKKRMKNNRENKDKAPS